MYRNMDISEFFTLIREMHSSIVIAYAFVDGTWRAISGRSPGRSSSGLCAVINTIAIATTALWFPLFFAAISGRTLQTVEGFSLSGATSSTVTHVAPISSGPWGSSLSFVVLFIPSAYPSFSSRDLCFSIMNHSRTSFERIPDDASHSGPTTSRVDDTFAEVPTISQV
ncbi:hypothetical protein EDD18DRAFT_352847 [Armillaria luteobubalina]|uniref:Uncharacterized protein n=1 Tax=Armillaria luteobubalina TaxID=153913 RepID=A0AA39ULV0_9AGAR|nr:hypothetical protein EDD18DRAFT_352847 [Armillaria luteobubalina]